MKIIYKNFIIEQDVYCYVLSEIGIKGEKAKEDTIGKEYICNQTFPATLEKAIEWIIKRVKANKQESIELRDFVEETKKIDAQFLSDLRDIIK